MFTAPMTWLEGSRQNAPLSTGANSTQEVKASVADIPMRRFRRGHSTCAVPSHSDRHRASPAASLVPAVSARPSGDGSLWSVRKPGKMGQCRSAPTAKDSPSLPGK
ncbi:MAG: hypothetical protein ABT00_23345 [Bordetella sp. SCN 68-11]|nr:MAG: hypothetical protein ABT00_23345 [Bordetella sp. SCN 68-11]